MRGFGMRMPREFPIRISSAFISFCVITL
jgi:hypothetical protein